MKNILLNRFIFFIAIFIVFLGSVGSVSAQQSAGVKVQPAIIEERVDPGSEYSFTMSVTNINSEEKTFYLIKQNIKGVEDNGTPIFAEDEEEETGYEITSWMSFSQESVTVAGGSTKEVTFSVSVPEDASPGSHFGGIFFDVRAPKLERTGAGVGYRVGSIINLRISGEAIEDMRLREFTAGSLIFDMPKVSFSTKVENLGNVLLRPHGLIEITDMRGKKIADVPINENIGGVFPNSERSFQSNWEHDGFAFGRYQALLGLVYGEDGRRTITGTISFWVLPIKPIAVFLGSIIFIILAVYVFVKMHIRKKLKRMGIDPAKANKVDLYNKKTKSISKLTFILLSLVVFIIVFLVILFFLFA